MGDESDKYRDDPHPWLLRAEHWLHAALPLVLVCLLAYLSLKLLTEIKHPALTYIELAVISYFTVELFILFLLYDSKRTFLRDKWLYILLILPIFATVRAAGRVGIAARSLVAIESLSVMSLSEVRGAHHITASLPTVQYTRYVPTVQKALHAVLDLPKVLRGTISAKSLSIKRLGKKITMVGIATRLTSQSKTDADEQDTDNPETNPNTNLNREKTNDS